MTGTSMEELKELISYCHEAEFTYNNKSYVLQPEISNTKAYLVIWDCSPQGQCICKHAIPLNDDIPKSVIEDVLNDKCFDGKSFYEIEANVTIDTIF
jgi:hypothetical protein